MKKSIKSGIILVAFILSCVSFPCVNSSVTCTPSGNTVECTIETTNSTLIGEKIEASLKNGITTLEIEIRKAGAGLSLNISLPQNIIQLQIDNKASSSISIGAIAVNSGVKSINLYGSLIEIKQRNFFTFFPSLEYFYAEKLTSMFFPFFTQNKQLTKIYVKSSVIEDMSSRVIDHTIFGGLDKLEYLRWQDGGITGMKSGSFKGLSKVTNINIYGNKIEELGSCTFDGLENLVELSISQNQISLVHPNAFLGLNKLQALYVSNNPSNPLHAITVLKGLTKLSLSKINPNNIKPEIIQQLISLKRLFISNIEFNCTCDTDWIPKLSSFGISIYISGSSCIGSAMSVTDAAHYTNCEARSYQCFNKSIECVGENWNRVDTGDGCECEYAEASYTASEICNDINECENSTICQGNCTNTPGSYKCSCLEGFHNVNDTFCGDINECHLSNGNCSHNCSNSLGSFECSCLTGYEKQGFSGCVDINECHLSNGNCSHDCSNTVGSYECTCLPGYLKNGSTECFLPDACSINNGGCQHNCTDTIDGYVCSCFEGFTSSPLNRSHCDKDISAETGERNADSKEPAFYVLFFLCLLFLATIIFLFVFQLLVFLYFRRQIQLLEPTHSSKVLSLAQLDKKKEEESTVIGNPITSQSVPVD